MAHQELCILTVRSALTVSNIAPITPCHPLSCSLLSDAIAHPSLPSEIGSQLVPLLDDESALVPYPVLRTICQSLREEDKDRVGPYLHQVLQGASPHLVSPPPRHRVRSGLLKLWIDGVKQKRDLMASQEQNVLVNRSMISTVCMVPTAGLYCH